MRKIPKQHKHTRTHVLNTYSNKSVDLVTKSTQKMCYKLHLSYIYCDPFHCLLLLGLS